MSTSAAPPNPCLLALLLVCHARTGTGSQIVFHYPPDPLAQTQTNLQDFAANDDDTSSDSEDWSTGDDYLTSFGRHTTTNITRSKYNHLNGDQDSHYGTASIEVDARSKQSLDPFLGLGEEGLVALLTPDRSWHKRRFELGINDLTFLGKPIFARQDGLWRKQKKKHKRKKNDTDGAVPSSDTGEGTGDEIVPGDEQASTSEHLSEEAPQAEKSPLTMFHMVFVMNPPALESKMRIDAMYEEIVKNFTRALKHEQSHRNYVWQQAEIILSCKSASPRSRPASQRVVSSEILERSSLARAMETVYSAISNSRIASITLSPYVSLPLQIIPATSTSTLPALGDPPIRPGLWLTTAVNSLATTSDGDGQVPNSTTEAAKSYTLLLKSRPQRIADEAQEVGGPGAAHILKFVADLRPTKSFHKLSMTSHTPLRNIAAMATHLIYWRRAILIPPLHQRDTYILSPNADLSKLRQACRSYQAQFPASMPNLPKVLKDLSGTPVPFGSLIPSPDHKEIYYMLLAWLLRNGWVTQLRTFAFVRVSADVKRAIREKDREWKMSDAQAQSQRNDVREEKELGRSPHKRPSFVSRPSSDGRRSIDGGRLATNQNTASLILNPPKASPEESRWLEYIAQNISLDRSTKQTLKPGEIQEVQKYWPVLAKYFNGSIGLETIPIREGLKRKFAWELFGKLGLRFDGGVEYEDGINTSKILTIRHW